MHRLFVAIRPPGPIRSQLLTVMAGVPGARWQSDDQLHLTLRFIGEVDRHCANDIADALSAIAVTPFDVAISGVGVFDRRSQVDTLWAGIQPRDPLAHLHGKIDRACVRAGLQAEQRAYLPHITLARFGRKGGVVEAFLAHHTALSTPTFTVGGFALFESRLGHDGASYHLIERYGSLHPGSGRPAISSPK